MTLDGVALVEAQTPASMLESTAPLLGVGERLGKIGMVLGWRLRSFWSNRSVDHAHTLAVAALP